MPRSAALMRPSAVTAAASVSTAAAPPTARAPRCTRCQSFAKPSSLEYWHIGDTRIRLRRVTPRITRGCNSRALISLSTQNACRASRNLTDTRLMLFATGTMARRIERAEAETAKEFGERALARGMDVLIYGIGGTHAVFAGAGQPFNKLAALGFAPVDEAD